MLIDNATSPLTTIADVNDTISFDINNRTIMPNQINDILVQEDNNSRNIEYTIQRYFENVDLSKKSIAIHFVNANRETDMFLVYKTVVTENNITFVWEITNKVTYVAGEVMYNIEFYDNANYQWFTKPATLIVEKGLIRTSEVSQPSATWIASWRREANDILNSCSVHKVNIEAIAVTVDRNAKKAETHSTKAAESSSSSALSATSSQASATASATSATNASISENIAKTEADRAAAAALTATTVAIKTPYIGADGFWYAWNDTTKLFVKSEVVAKGDKGDMGKNFSVLGMYPTYELLVAAHPTGHSGDAWSIGTAGVNSIFIWDTIALAWKDIGILNSDSQIKAAISSHAADTALHPTADKQSQWDSAFLCKSNATVAKVGNVVKITAPQGVGAVTFYAPSDFVSTDSYALNGTAITLCDLQNAPLQDSWKIGAPVTLSIKGTVGFFKTGGGGINDTLPSQVKNFSAVARDAMVELSWQNPTSDFTGVLICRKVGSAPTSVIDGAKVYEGTATTYNDTALTNGTSYHYRAFTYNSKKQYQTELDGAAVSATPLGRRQIYSLPVGTLVVDKNTKYYGAPIVWKVANRTLPQTTLITDRIITLKCFDGTEPINSDIGRRTRGNNRYLYSNIHQWLNSAAGAGAWYAAQHSADAPPAKGSTLWTSYDMQAGFLNTFSSNFLNAIKTNTRTVAKPVTDGGGPEEISSKIFLASQTEVGLANENNIVEGVRLELFTDAASRLAKPTAEAINNSDYKEPSLLNVNSPWHWWLRTPQSLTSDCVALLGAGGLDSSQAFGGAMGVRPLCVVDRMVMVYSHPNAQGEYEFAWEV